jgi:hypothetical protein
MADDLSFDAFVSGLWSENYEKQYLNTIFNMAAENGIVSGKSAVTFFKKSRA